MIAGHRGNQDKSRGGEMKVKPAIRRYEHNHFQGWVVSFKRRGRRCTKYFSDKPDGRLVARQCARQFCAQMLAELPKATKVKRTYVLNTTGVIGVSRVRDRTRTGRFVWRYVAQWPILDGMRARASFSIGRFGEQEARKRAVQARHDGLAQLGLEA